jgi:hypothetical protein
VLADEACLDDPRWLVGSPRSRVGLTVSVHASSPNSAGLSRPTGWVGPGSQRLLGRWQSDAGSDVVRRCCLLHRLPTGWVGRGVGRRRAVLLASLPPSGRGLLHRLRQTGNGTGRLAALGGWQRVTPPDSWRHAPTAKKSSSATALVPTSTRDKSRHLLPRRCQGRRSVKLTAQYSCLRLTSPQAFDSNTRRGKKRPIRSNIAGMPRREPGSTTNRSPGHGSDTYYSKLTTQ